jgi:uncharacterized membrane protein YedE/YeeE
MFEMFVRKGLFSGIGRSAAMATVVAVALTTVGPVSAFAGSARAGLTAASPGDGITDVSARRRVYRGGGGAAAAAAFAGIVGTGIAIAAAQNRRDYYDSYGYAPGYYGGGPVYYGGGPAYYGGYGSSVPYFHGHPNAGW